MPLSLPGRKPPKVLKLEAKSEATDARLGGLKRWLLRSVSAWRYHLGFYHHPLELRALHKLVSYRRPETSGF